MASNPKTSKWYATPNALRARKNMTVTLSADARAKLELLAPQYGSRSAAIEALVMAALVR